MPANPDELAALDAQFERLMLSGMLRADLLLALDAQIGRVVTQEEAQDARERMNRMEDR